MKNIEGAQGPLGPPKYTTAQCSRSGQKSNFRYLTPDRFGIGGNSNTFSTLFPWTKIVKLGIFIMHIM